MKRIGIAPAVLLSLSISGPAPAADTEQASPDLRELAGVWKEVSTRAQVGLCRATSSDRIVSQGGRRTSLVGKVRIERRDDGKWQVKRLFPDGTVESPVRLWTMEISDDGSILSSRNRWAYCPDEPKRFYTIALEGEIEFKKKRTRIELRGVDRSCPEAGCSFKVTHVLTRSPGKSP